MVTNGHENTISRLDINSASAAILFEGYALILVFKQIFVFLIYVGRLAEIFVLLARSCFGEITAWSSHRECTLSIHSSPGMEFRPGQHSSPPGRRPAWISSPKGW